MASPGAAGVDLESGLHENALIYTGRFTYTGAGVHENDLIYTGAGVDESTGVHKNGLVYTGIIIYTGGLLQGLQGLIYIASLDKAPVYMRTTSSTPADSSTLAPV